MSPSSSNITSNYHLSNSSTSYASTYHDSLSRKRIRSNESYVDNLSFQFDHILENYSSDNSSSISSFEYYCLSSNEGKTIIDCNDESSKDNQNEKHIHIAI